MRKARRTPRRKSQIRSGRSRSRRFRRSTRYKATAPGTYFIKDGSIVWTLPRKLRSLNVLCSRLARYGDTKAWEKQFETAVLVASDGSIGPSSKQRLRLDIRRLSPSKRFFLDRTNLAGGVKGLEDSLIRLEYLVDDSEAWEDGPYVTQGLSEDGKYWTIVTLSVIRHDAPSA